MTHSWCSLEGKSFTDLLTNTIFLAPLATATEVIELLHCRLESRKLTEFVHEFVHHQSLSSTVGMALCLLGFGSRRSAWVMNETKQQRYANNFADREMRYVAANAALRPLAEGLALLAEYDAYPGSTDPRSLVMMLSRLIGTGFYPDVTSNDLLATKLEMARVSRAEKKADLFSLPFSAVGGGYLLGYCVIKHYWRLAARHDLFFLEADKFLIYCMAVIFGDFAQVSGILDFSGTEDFYPERYSKSIASRAIHSLESYFNDPRLPERRAAASLAAQTAAQSEVPVTALGSRRYSISETFDDPLGFCSKKEIADGNTLLKKWIGWQNSPEPNLEPFLPDGFVALQNVAFNGRHIARLMSLPVNWKLRGEHLVLGDTHFTIESEIEKAEFAGEGAEGAGSIEIIVHYHDLSYAPILVTEKGTHLLVSFARGARPKDRSQISSSFWAEPDLEQWAEDSRLSIMPAADWDKLRSAVESTAADTYQTAVVPQLAPAHEAAFLKATGQDGLFGILEDAAMLRTLAFASILASPGISSDHLLDGLQRIGYEKQAVSEINRRYRSVGGIDVIDLAKDPVTVLI